MRLLERVVGLWLHKSIIRHPVAHAALLNQYRGAEEFQKRYPRILCAHLLPEGNLRNKYIKHQSDEERHEQLLSRRIQDKGVMPESLPPERDYLLQLSHALRTEGTGISYDRFQDERPFDDDEQARLFAFQIVTEERGVTEMELHRDACQDQDPRTHALFLGILQDERFHVEYSRRAFAVLVKANADSLQSPLLEKYRRVERSTYSRVTGAFLQHMAGDKRHSLSRRARITMKVLGRGMTPRRGGPVSAGEW